MDWASTRAGFLDELVKISEVDLRGLSPEAAMGSAPPPAENMGFQKARAILDLAASSQEKTAAPKVRRALATGHPGIGKLMDQGDSSANERAKSVAGYGLAGAGAGKVVSELGTRSPWASRWAGQNPARLAHLGHIGWGAMAGGTALGAGYGLYRQHQKAKQRMMAKASAVLSPGIALRSAQQVGKMKNVVHSGPGIKHQIAGQLIGKKFA